MTKKTIANGKEWTRRQVEEYKRLYNNYKVYAAVLSQVLEQIAKRYAPSAIVQIRPKSIANFAEKCQRKKAKYNEPVNSSLTCAAGESLFIPQMK